jgi:hypothetical protein
VKLIIKIQSNCTRGPINGAMKSKSEDIAHERKSCMTSARRYVKCTEALNQNPYQLRALINVIKWPKVVEI